MIDRSTKKAFFFVIGILLAGGSTVYFPQAADQPIYQIGLLVLLLFGIFLIIKALQ